MNQYSYVSEDNSLLKEDLKKTEERWEKSQVKRKDLENVVGEGRQSITELNVIITAQKEEIIILKKTVTELEMNITSIKQTLQVSCLYLKSMESRRTSDLYFYLFKRGLTYWGLM